MKIMSKCNVFVISLFTLGLLGCASTKDNMVAKGFLFNMQRVLMTGVTVDTKRLEACLMNLRKTFPDLTLIKSMLKVGLMDSDSVRVNRKPLSVKPE